MKKDKKERKAALFNKIAEIIQKYDKFLVIQMDHVTSTQLQECKKAWKGKGEFLFRKNTMMKKALEALLEEGEKYKQIMKVIEGNVAFLFTNEEIRPLKEIIEGNQRIASAKTGAIAQKDLWIEPMLTTMGPSNAPYFQALGISYKITKSKLEIISSIKVLEEGIKVGPAQANLLSILDIHPFVYMMKIKVIYENGAYYEPWIVDLEEKDVTDSLKSVIGTLAALSLASGLITQASIPYYLVNCAKDAIAVALAINLKTKETSPFMID